MNKLMTTIVYVSPNECVLCIAKRYTHTHDLLKYSLFEPKEENYE